MKHALYIAVVAGTAILGGAPSAPSQMARYWPLRRSCVSIDFG